jgi:hypothetical protein
MDNCLELGGLNIIDLCTKLGICNLKFLRNAIYTGSRAGKLLLMSLKYTQLEAGVPFAILEKPHINIPYITPMCWATSVRQFLYQHKLSVNISDNHKHRITIAINGVIYPTRIDEQIRYHINGSYLKELIKRKHRWSKQLWNSIDITAFSRYFKTLSTIYNHWGFLIRQNDANRARKWSSGALAVASSRKLKNICFTAQKIQPGKKQ